MEYDPRPGVFKTAEDVRRAARAVLDAEAARRGVGVVAAPPQPGMTPILVAQVTGDQEPGPDGRYYYPGKFYYRNTFTPVGAWVAETALGRDCWIEPIVDGEILHPGYRYEGYIAGIFEFDDPADGFMNYPLVVVTVPVILLGCNIKQNPEDGSYYVDPGEFLVDACFLIDYTDPYCPLVTLDYECLGTEIFNAISITTIVPPGCGLEWNAGLLRVKRADLAGNKTLTSLVIGPGVCDIGVDLEYTDTFSRTLGGPVKFARNGNKIVATQSVYRDTDYFNAAALHIDRTVTKLADLVQEFDVCDPDCCTPCTITFTTSVDDESITLGAETTLTIDSLSGCTGPYDLTIDWGDGTIEQFSSVVATDTFTHTYATAGTYHVTADVYDACGYNGTATDIEVTVAASGACCPSTPATLYAHLVPASCASFAVTITLVYSGGSWYGWYLAGSGDYVELTLSCAGSSASDWTLGVNCSDTYPDSWYGPEPGASCGPPVSLVFNVPLGALGPCCDFVGGATVITVNETP